MTTITRQAVLDVLRGDWATYVQRYHCLSPEGQSNFLAEQGYARFAGLLSHIVAWWEVGRRAVESYLSDPDFLPRGYDVDAFNAAAVARVNEAEEEEVIADFEKMRLSLIEFVKALPEAAFANEKVCKQFNMELIGHLSDHNVPE